MRRFFAILATLALAQCAGGAQQDSRFHVGANAQGLVIIGLAEAAANTSPVYTMLWRRLDPATGAFLPHGDATIFETHTNDDRSIRIRGIPGEFEMQRLTPGVYGLDSVYAVIAGRHVNYFAQGVVVGPDRPVFEVRAGEAIYLGIWQMNLTEASAVTQLWRLDARDAEAVARAANATVGEVVARETGSRAVPCSPHRLSTISQRQIC
jgi:hypothetical protein